MGDAPQVPGPSQRPAPPGNPGLGDAATCRPDPGSTARLEGRGVAAEAGNRGIGESGTRGTPPPGLGQPARGLPPESRRTRSPAPTSLAAAQPHFGPRGKPADSGAFTAPVVRGARAPGEAGGTAVPGLSPSFSCPRISRERERRGGRERERGVTLPHTIPRIHSRTPFPRSLCPAEGPLRQLLSPPPGAAPPSAWATSGGSGGSWERAA